MIAISIWSKIWIFFNSYHPTHPWFNIKIMDPPQSCSSSIIISDLSADTEVVTPPVPNKSHDQTPTSSSAWLAVERDDVFYFETITFQVRSSRSLWLMNHHNNSTGRGYALPCSQKWIWSRRKSFWSHILPSTGPGSNSRGDWWFKSHLSSWNYKSQFSKLPSCFVSLQGCCDNLSWMDCGARSGDKVGF